jgi:hypothetical protein
MAANIVLNNLADGQQIIVPYEVSGSATPLPPANAITALARQVDANPLQSLPTSTTFAFDLTVADCPVADTWHRLTMYAWDSSGDCSTISVSFKNVGDPPPPPPPGFLG